MVLPPLTASLSWGSWPGISCNTLPPCWGSGQWYSCDTLRHGLGAVGSGPPATHCLTAWGQWAVGLLQCAAPLPYCGVSRCGVPCRGALHGSALRCGVPCCLVLCRVLLCPGVWLPLFTAVLAWGADGAG